jgi:hypothetical protein
MPRGENWGAPSVIAAFAGFDRESTASYERNDDNDCYYGSVHSPVPSRIKKTPVLGLGSFFTQTNRALGVSGDGESARLGVTLGRRHSEICIELLTLNRRWISGITRLSAEL